MADGGTHCWVWRPRCWVLRSAQTFPDTSLPTLSSTPPTHVSARRGPCLSSLSPPDLFNSSYPKVTTAADTISCVIRPANCFALSILKSPRLTCTNTSHLISYSQKETCRLAMKVRKKTIWLKSSIRFWGIFKNFFCFRENLKCSNVPQRVLMHFMSFVKNETHCPVFEKQGYQGTCLRTQGIWF